MTAEEYAKYVGTADTRVMHANDWRSAGIEDQATVVWGPANEYSVPRSALSDAAWEALANDPGIVFTGDRPSVSDRTEAAVEAAKRRLRARMEGNEEVLHSQDDIPAVL